MNNNSCLSTFITALLAHALLGWIFMLIWNWLLVDLVKFPEITFWQGVGIIILGNIIVSMFRKKS